MSRGGDIDMNRMPEVEDLGEDDDISIDAPADTHESGRHGENHHEQNIGEQNMRLLQYMSGMLQDAMAQQRRDMERMVDAKLSSRGSGRRNPTPEINRGTGRRTETETPPENSKRVSFKTFKTCGATEFSGNIDPMGAYNWLDTMERVFEISHCWDSDRVTYAAAMLTDSAMNWWKNTGTFMGMEQRRALSWGEFTEIFLEEYCPPDLQRKYTIEFLELKQGDMTVEAYQTEFQRKAKFAGEYLISERERITRFVEGLRNDIRDFLELKHIPSLAKAAEYARIREQAVVRRDADIMPPPKRQFTGGYSQASALSRPSRHSKYTSSRTQTKSHSRSHSVSQA